MVSRQVCVVPLERPRAQWSGSIGAVIMSILTKMNKEHVTEAFPRAKFMFLATRRSTSLRSEDLLRFFFFCNSYLYILSVLGLRCCVGFCLVKVHGLLIAAASLVAEHGLGCTGLSTCSSGAPEHRLDSCGRGPSCSATYGISQNQGLNLWLLQYWQRTLYYWAIWHGWIWKHSGRKAAHFRWLRGQISTHP